ncbi:unnamed protein product [Didymodactylos carnosus]|uniref:Uncharacterized protein n=1 Tax=Didymodactylos carnosus TaxID=1234261 RepID=A0A815FKS5_9BILA|nr:unnamed protein product [Didymodactylos carnosus]CAF4179422.1 unnamed protein product [Didymodactylos carnosus]
MVSMHPDIVSVYWDAKKGWCRELQSPMYWSVTDQYIDLCIDSMDEGRSIPQYIGLLSPNISTHVLTA